MDHDLPLEQVFIVATWLEAVFYGLLVALFFQSLYVLLHGRRRDALNLPMLVAVILMFAIATAHLGMNLYRLIQAYVFHRLTPGGPVAYLGNLLDAVHIAKDTMYATQSLIGDALSIYRCFVVWNRNWLIVAFPLCMLAVSIVSGYMVIYLYTQITPDVDVFDSRLSSYIKIFYSLALAQNVITTSLIAYHIYLASRKSSSYMPGKSNLIPVVRILIESAAFYSIAELVLVTLYGVGYNAQYIVLESITPIVGIVFTLIIIRVGLRVPGAVQTPLRSGTGVATIGGTVRTGTGSKHVAMHPITVNVCRQVIDDLENAEMGGQKSFFDETERPGYTQ